MVRVDDVFVGHKDGAFNAVFKFAHVSGPRVTHEHVDGGAGKAAHVLAHDAAVMFHKVVRQEHYIRLAVPERRHVNREDVQLVIEIFTEGSFFDHLLQVLGSGRNHAHVHLLGNAGANTFHLAVLQQAQ